MFKSALNELKQHLRTLADAQWRALAGMAFVLMAMAAIEYEERVAPEMARLSAGWSQVSDFSRRLASFNL
jgi:hypothetical protein